MHEQHYPLLQTTSLHCHSRVICEVWWKWVCGNWDSSLLFQRGYKLCSDTSYY